MSHRFVRYVRRGAASAIAQREGDTSPAPSLRPRLDVTVDIAENGAVSAFAPPPLRLLGPADAAGLDPTQIRRVHPLPDTVDADPELFPFVELRYADLPWLFTPYAPAGANDTLRPWMCLVCVARVDGVELLRGPGATVLTIAPPATLDELPPLRDAHAWAHAQAAGVGAGDDVGELFAAASERTLARLVCPRRLADETSYVACLVPTFEGGRRAGLGEEVDEATGLAPAWESGTALPLRLPVLHAWEFRTGEAMSFEGLARRLAGRAPPPGAGRRPLDASAPGGGLPAAPGTELQLDGALHQPNTPVAAPPAALSAALAGAIDRPHALSPPRYGRWHAAAATGAASPGWLDELNGDAVRRVAAAVGTRVVQERQEELMAAAWAQVGEVLQANALLRGAQLGLAASERTYERRLRPLLADVSGFAIAGPALNRVRTDAFTTVHGTVGESCLPLLALSGAFRRFARPTGPLGRRAHRARDVPIRLGPLLGRLAAGELRDVPPDEPDGIVAIPASALKRRPGLPPDLAERLGALARLADVLEDRAAPPSCTPLDVGAVAEALAAGLDPRVTIPARVGAQIRVPAGLRGPGAQLDQIMAAPRITTPMYRPLVDRSPQWLLPGIDAVAPETVMLVEPNRRFIEAYMVGLNHEMGRELLWRGYPTDQRGTVFDRFWDSAGTGEAAGAAINEIEPIHTWARASGLGAHPGTGRAALLVLLLRGELLRRFPGATIFLQRARLVRGRREPEGTIGGPATLLALFRGRLDPDVVFVGFALPPVEASGGTAASPHGWYVTLQEQPRDLRFGVGSSGGDAGAEDPSGWRSWNDLVWEALQQTPGDYVDLTRTQADGFATGPAPRKRPADLTLVPPLDGRADGVAAAFVKRPFRLFLHADDLLA